MAHARSACTAARLTCALSATGGRGGGSMECRAIELVLVNAIIDWIAGACCLLAATLYRPGQANAPAASRDDPQAHQDHRGAAPLQRTAGKQLLKTETCQRVAVPIAPEAPRHAACAGLVGHG